MDCSKSIYLLPVGGILGIGSRAVTNPKGVNLTLNKAFEALIITSCFGGLIASIKELSLEAEDRNYIWYLISTCSVVLTHPILYDHVKNTKTRIAIYAGMEVPVVSVGVYLLGRCWSSRDRLNSGIVQSFVHIPFVLMYSGIRSYNYFQLYSKNKTDEKTVQRETLVYQSNFNQRRMMFITSSAVSCFLYGNYRNCFTNTTLFFHVTTQGIFVPLMVLFSQQSHFMNL